MKANEFIADWDRRHTSSPSFQDALDWAEQKINHDAIVISSVIRDAHIKQILTTVSIISVTPGKYSEE